MHERTYRAILQYALNGKAPILTPIEKEAYDRCRREVLENPGVEWIIPTDFPDSGIEMRYAGARGDGLTLDEVTKLSETAEAVIGILESHGMVCEDGALTVAYDDRIENRMEMKTVNLGHHLVIPRFGSAVPGQLEEQFSYGIPAYTMRNFNPDNRYVMKTLEEIVCRVVSVYILRALKLPEKAEAVLQNGGTPFICDSPDRLWERAGNTAEDIRSLAKAFRKADMVPFLKLRDYVKPFDSPEHRSLNREALRSNYPDSEAVQLLCSIAARIESDSDDLADYMMGDPYPD